MKTESVFRCGLLLAIAGAVNANGGACYNPPVTTVTTYVTESQPTSTWEQPTTYVPPVESTSSTPPAETSSSIPPVESTSTIAPSETTSTSVPAASCRPTTWTRDQKAPSVGILRAALVFVDFPDMAANTTTQELYEFVQAAPTEMFNNMSYGKLDLEFVPLLDQFYRMPSASSSYNYSRALTTEMHLKYINDALNAVGPSVSFAGIDVLYVLPAKYADEISFSTATAVDITAPDGSVLGNSITFGQDLYFSWGSKTINHETGHTIGLPDLYPYGPGEVTQWVGGFDLMGLISAQSPDYFAWHKWQLDWIEDSQVDCVTTNGKTTHRISPIEVAGNVKAAAIPISATAFVMAEVRSNLGVDKDACGTGVLLYTADTAISSGEGPVRVLDTKPNSGGCGFNNGGELNDAPMGVGSTFDTGLGVIVTVTAQEGDDYIIEVERQV